MQLIHRVVGLLARPRQEWQTIADEATPPKAVALRYLLPLAMLAAVVSVAAMFVRIGAWEIPGGAANFLRTFSWSFAYFIVLPMAVVAISAFVIDGFATTFHGTPDRTQSFKLAAYSYTPALLVLVLIALLPPHPSLVIVAFAALGATGYLLFVGSPILMRSPADRAVPYALVGLLAMYGAAQLITPLMAFRNWF